MASILFNIARIYNSQFKCKYVKNEKLLLNFLFHFWNPHQILNILKKKMMVIANVFPNFQTVKNFFTPLCKNGRFGTRLDSPRVKVSRILAKRPWECFYHVFSSIWGKLIWKISPLVLGEISGVLLNTLSADGKYPFRYIENWNSQFKCQYLKNERLFLTFLFHFWNLHQILNILKKKMMVIANILMNL